MKLRLAISLFCLAICAGAVWATDTPPADEAAIRTSVGPAIANVFAALKAHDWAQMRRDFAPEMLENLSKKQLAVTFDEVEKKLGRYASNSFARIERNDKWVLVYHTVNFASGDMLLQFTFKANDPTWKVAGLILRPVEKPPAK
jgi:hypothetical protein